MKPAPPVTTTCMSGAPLRRLPFGLARGEKGMGHEEMPQDGLNPFGLRSDVLGRRRGNADAHICLLLEGALGAPDDADDRGAALTGQLDRPHQADADATLAVTTADREHEQAVVGTQVGRTEPVRVRMVPPVVVDTRGQLGDVVRYAVGLDLRELPEVTGSVRRVSRASTRAAQE